MKPEIPLLPLLLLVEDDLEIRETLAMLLASRGFDVIAACHGRDALDQARARGSRPAIVILDMLMPVMDGEEFLIEQAHDPLLSNVPVVILTAQLHIPTLPANVRAVLRKPVQISTLVCELEDALHHNGIPMATLARGTGSIHETVLAAEAQNDEVALPRAPIERERPGSEP